MSQEIGNDIRHSDGKFSGENFTTESTIAKSQEAFCALPLEEKKKHTAFSSAGSPCLVAC
jgi:hypothetical protein